MSNPSRNRSIARVAAAGVLGLLSLATALVLDAAPASAGATGSNGYEFAARDLDYGPGYRPFSGDFDADGNTDIFWYGPGTVVDRIEFSGPSRAFATIPVNGNYLPFVGDFDGDRRDDVFWYMPRAAPDFVWYSRGRNGFESYRKDVNGSFQPVVGRFTFDATDDIIWYAPGAAPDFFWDFEVDRTSNSRPMPINGSYRPLVANLSDRVDGWSHPGVDDILWVAADPGGSSVRWLTRSDGTFSASTVRGIGGRRASFVPMATAYTESCPGKPTTPTNNPYGPYIPKYCWPFADATKPARPTVILTASGTTPIVFAVAQDGGFRSIDIGQGSYPRSGAVAIPVLEPAGKVARSLVFFSTSETTSSWDCDAVDRCTYNGGPGAPEAAGTVPLRYGKGGAEVVYYRPSAVDRSLRSQTW
jgi:hypothetical protein